MKQSVHSVKSVCQPTIVIGCSNKESACHLVQYGSCPWNSQPRYVKWLQQSSVGHIDISKISMQKAQQGTKHIRHLSC